MNYIDIPKVWRGNKSKSQLIMIVWILIKLMRSNGAHCREQTVSL